MTKESGETSKKEEEKKDGESSHRNFNRNNFKKSSYDTSKLQCYKCKKIGHITPNRPQRTKANEQSNLVEEDLEPTLLMAILEDSDERNQVKEVKEPKVSLHEEDVGYKETNIDSLWYLDNGNSNHMTGVREHFKELDEKVSGKVRFGDGSYIEIKGKGIEVIQTSGDISIKQTAYANKILKEAGMIDCNETLIPMDPGTRLTKITEGTMVNSTEYQSLIGCLRYLLHTRPNLSCSIRLLSHFMQEPREQHMKAIRQVLRYVKGTNDYGITYKHNGGDKKHGFSDSSYGVNTQEGKRTIGIIFYYGESPISWSTQKQAIVALSSCESEFIAATATATQALWLKRLLSKLTHSEEEKITIMVDNKSAIALMKNLVFHGRSKHIDTKYHFIRECIEREDIQVESVSGEYQKAAILTKALPKIKFLIMRQLIGLKDLRQSDCD
nr:ribonuclease H-like domain, reverse transcriptase, RNA-dependent DNA polymerase [Tanacetum cinerariifolium]